MGIEADNLFIKELRVDKGIVMKRMMPAAMGTGHRINKRTSHLFLLLAERVATAKDLKKKTNKKIANVIIPGKQKIKTVKSKKSK